jgi:CheY-like chemotaxis protein
VALWGNRPRSFAWEQSGKLLARVSTANSMSRLIVRSESGPGTEQRKKARILVVDDYADARTLLAIALTRRGGYDVSVASDAQEALRLINERFVHETDEGTRRLDLDLLVVDIMMSEMSGLELLANLAESVSSLPRVMVISAANAPDRLGEALRLGASEYVSKPIELDLLLYKVRTMLEEDESSPLHWGTISPGSQVMLGTERGIARAINEGGLWVRAPSGTSSSAIAATASSSRSSALPVIRRPAGRPCPGGGPRARTRTPRARTTAETPGRPRHAGCRHSRNGPEPPALPDPAPR